MLPTALAAGDDLRLDATTPDVIQLVGDGSLQAPGLERLVWSGPAGASPGFGVVTLEATGVRVREWSVLEGGIGPFAHRQYTSNDPAASDAPVRDVSYRHLRGAITQFGAGFDVRVLAREPLYCGGDFKTDIAIKPVPASGRSSAVVTTGDPEPRDRFMLDPVETLSAAPTDLVMNCEGRFDLYLADLRLDATVDGQAQPMRARNDPVASGADAARQTSYFILEFEHATVQVSAHRGHVRLHAPSVVTGWVGALNAALLDGTLTRDGQTASLTAAPLELAGAFGGILSFVPSTEGGRARIHLVDARPSAAQESGLDSAAQPVQAVPWFALVGGFVVGVALVGAAAPRWIRRVPAATRAPVAPAAPPVEGVKGGSVEHFEQLYRADPDNLAAGLELALAYAGQDRFDEALPLLLMGVQAFPKADMPRYYLAIALLKVGRVEDAAQHLDYAFRLNTMNVARFVKEAADLPGAEKPPVQRVLLRWSRRFHEANNRGYA